MRRSRGLARTADSLGRVLGRLEKRLPGVGLWVLVIAGMGVYLFAVALAGLAVFRDYLPDWLMEDIHTYLFAGNRNVELSLSLLADWGLIDIMKNTVIGAIVFAVAVVGLLIVTNLLILWARRRRRLREAERLKEQQRPRIRLKNPVIVTIDDGKSRTKHRYTVHISLVVARASDLDAVVETIAGLRPFLTSAAEGVIRAAYMRIDPEIMASALTRAAAEATGGSVDQVELMDLTHLEIDRQTGELMAGKQPLARPVAATSASAAPLGPPDRLAEAKTAKRAAPDDKARFRTSLLPPSEIGSALRPAAASQTTAQEAPRARGPAPKPEFEPGAALARVLPSEPAPPETATAPEATAPAPEDASAAAAEPADPDANGNLDLRKIKQMMSGLRSS